MHTVYFIHPVPMRCRLTLSLLRSASQILPLDRQPNVVQPKCQHTIFPWIGTQCLRTIIHHLSRKNLLLYVLLLTRSPLIQMLFRMLCEFGPVIPTCQNGQRGIVRNIFKRCSVVKLEDTSGVNLVCKAVNTEKGSIIVRAASGRPCCVWSAA